MSEKKAEIIPYLTFAGDCEEAVQTYMQAFGGEIFYLSRWSEQTAALPEQIGKAMHAEFLLGGTRMSAGDSADALKGNAAIKLMVHMGSKDEAENAIAALSEGGSILSPLQPHPAPDDAGCGSVTKDRFGYTWIITCPNPDKK